nr:retrotransposon Orf1 [Tanacetum cinerariifolium]
MDNTNSPPLPPEVPTSILFEKVLKLNSILESLNLIPSSCCSRVVCKKEKDSYVMLIQLIKNNDCPSNEELDEDGNVLGEEDIRGDNFDKFPTRRELAHHKYLMSAPIISMILKDISWVIDPRMSPVVLAKPFVEISKMTYDLSLGVVKFTNEIKEIAYKMPHKIEQYDSLLDMEKENSKSFYFRNEGDKRREVEYVMRKILGFYKGCLELGPEYRTGPEESGSRSDMNNKGGVT